MHRGIVMVYVHRFLIPGTAVLKHARHGGFIDAGGAFQIKRAPGHGVVLINLHAVAVKLIPVGGIAFLDLAAGGIQHGVLLALAAQQHPPVVQDAVHRLLAHRFAIRAVQIRLGVRAFHAHRIALGPMVLLHFLLVILDLLNVVVIRIRQGGQHVQFRVHLLGPVAVEQVMLPIPHHVVPHAQAADAAGVQIIEAVVGHVGAGLHPLAAQQKQLPPRHNAGDGPLLLQQLGTVGIVHGVVVVCIALIVQRVRHHKQVRGVRLPVSQHIHVSAFGAEHLLPGPQHPPHRGGLLPPGEAAAVGQVLTAGNDQTVGVVGRLPGSIHGALGLLCRAFRRGFGLPAAAQQHQSQGAQGRRQPTRYKRMVHRILLSRPAAQAPGQAAAPFQGNRFPRQGSCPCGLLPYENRNRFFDLSQFIIPDSLCNGYELGHFFFYRI